MPAGSGASAPDGPVDAALVAAAAGTADPSADGSCEVTVRFPNGATRVRYADVEFVRSTRAERLWAYLRIAGAPPPARDAVAEAVAAELESAHPRAALAVGAWTAPRARAAAIYYATREHPSVHSAAPSPGSVGGVVRAPDVRAPSPASTRPAAGAAEAHAPVEATWRSLPALAAAVAPTDAGALPPELAAQPAAELAATAPAMAASAITDAAAREVRAAALRGWLGPVRIAPGATGTTDRTSGAATDAILLVAPTAAQLERAFPDYARRQVAAREGWPPEDTIALVDLMRRRELDENAARYGAAHGSGVARDLFRRVYTRESRFVDGPRAALQAELAARPDLADRPLAEWVLQADALRQLAGVAWVTLMRHTASVRVPGAGGQRDRVWVHLPPAVEAQLGRPSLAAACDAFTAAWHAARRESSAAGATPAPPPPASRIAVPRITRAHATASAAAGAGAPAAAAGASPSGGSPDQWALSPAVCVVRQTFLDVLGERGIGVGYTTYLAAVRAGYVHEVRAVPAGGGQTSAHVLVPPTVRDTRDKTVIRAWLTGEYADPSAW